MFQDRSKWREGNRCATSFPPHQIARQEQRNGLEAAFGKGMSLRDALFNGGGGVQARIRDVHGAKQRLGDVAALRLPGIALAKRAAIGDEHQQRDFVEMREGDYAVDGGEKSMSLDEHGGLDAGKVRD